VNPDAGQPTARIAEGWGAGRRAVLVGGGPAGLEVARRPAIGGWRTILIEREARLGGQIALWSQTPSRVEFLQLVNWWSAECECTGVDVRSGAAADAALLTRMAPDLVVVATGSWPVDALFHIGVMAYAKWTLRPDPGGAPFWSATRYAIS
jgi:NADPH-dependent 2,4-dienoyl-CoA reductase/sulfur reductase-like enzyme